MKTDALDDLRALALSLSAEATGQFAEADKVRSAYAREKHPGPRKDPARHIEAAGFCYHSQALGVLKAMNVLDRAGKR